MKIGINIICTGKYGIFLQPLLDGICKHFFVDDQVEVYLFTDKDHELRVTNRVSIITIPVEHKPFPFATLYRYKYFVAAAEYYANCDFLFYIDVDMAIVDNVGKEILPSAGLIATFHPGFYNAPGGAWGNDPESKSFTPLELRVNYYAGGFQGGSTKEYLEACKEMANDIEDDEKRGVIAEHNDETHWNRYLCTRSPKTLTPDYCMVEQEHLRQAWGISNFQPKIIALEKNHEEIRN